MPRKPKPWFRFYTEAITDPKLRRFTPAQRWLWCAMLAAARTSCVSGSLFITDGVPYTARDLADYANVRPVEVTKALPLMAELGMISLVGDLIVITKWPGRQFESDDVTTRVQRWKQQRSNVATDDVATTKQHPNVVGSNNKATTTLARASAKYLSREEQTSENRPQKRGSVDHLQTARAALDEPPPDLEPEPLTPTQQVAADFQEWLTETEQPRPPKAVRSGLSGQIHQLLSEDIPADQVLAGLKAWQTKGLGPGALPSVVHEVRSRAPNGRSRRQAETDHTFDQALAWAAQQDQQREAIGR